MWDWINCNLLGRHQQTVSCERGSIHLRCLRCGHRSDGWQLEEPAQVMRAAGPPSRRPLMHLILRQHS
jgi:hypothetical protein